MFPKALLQHKSETEWLLAFWNKIQTQKASNELFFSSFVLCVYFTPSQSWRLYQKKKKKKVVVEEEEEDEEDEEEDDEEEEIWRKKREKKLRKKATNQHLNNS